MDFDNSIIFKNISYLIKKNKRKVRELEEAAGVSVGYISRTSKDPKLKPGIDFIMRISGELGVSIDLLVNYDLESLSSTQVYLYGLLDKMILDTRADKLDWKKTSKEKLNHLRDGDEDVPCVLVPSEKPHQDRKGKNEGRYMIFDSHTFGDNTYFYSDMLQVELGEDAELYIMPVGTAVSGDMSGIKYDKAIEIWISSNEKKEFICSNKSDSALSDKIDSLISSVLEYVERPVIPEMSRAVIDKYMENR